MDERGLQLGPWRIDLVYQTAATGGEVISLSTSEVALFTFLMAQEGPVSRQTILTEVLGYAPSIQSRAVGMLLSRLKKKMDGTGAPFPIQSKRGAGVWLDVEVASTPVSTSWSPIFATPYTQRLETETQLATLLEAGWTVVTLVGPGGVGKTRVAAEVMRHLDHQVIGLSCDGRDTDALLRQLSSEARITSGKPELIRQALLNRGTVVYLDEAETSLQAARALVQSLHPVPFLVTSREPLGFEEEAVVELSRMPMEQALTFLTGRLAATRWNRDVQPETLAKVVEWVDGLPLGLELAAGDPEGLDAWVAALSSGELPRGEAGHRLKKTLERSIASLPVGQQRLLKTLTQLQSSLSTHQIEHWLGPDVLADLRGLADRSLLERRRDGWTVLHTTRAVAAERITHEPLGPPVSEWLAQMSLELMGQMHTDPLKALPVWRRLTDDMIACLKTGDVEHSIQIARGLWMLFDHLGPTSAFFDVIRIARSRQPDDPAARAMGVAWGEDQSVALNALRHDSDPARQLMGLEVAAQTFDVETASWAARFAQDLSLPLRMRLEAQIHHHHAEVIRHKRRGTAPEALIPLRDGLARLMAQTEPFPVLQIQACWPLAFAMAHLGDNPAAERVLRRSVEVCATAGLIRDGLFARYRLAQLLKRAAPRRAAEIFLDLGRDYAHAGEQAGDCYGTAGILLYSLDDLDGAVAALEKGSDANSPGLRSLSDALREVARLRLGDTTRAAGLMRASVQYRRYDGSDASAALTTVIRTEAALSHMDPTNTEGRQQLRDRLVAAREPSLELITEQLLFESLERRLGG